MAETVKTAVEEQRPGAQAAAEPGLERGAYEVIRNRLNQAGANLRERLTRLNHARKEVFGSIETELLATGRVTTEYNCVPRDITPLGKLFIFGYNVQMGLKSETRIADVFAIYEFREHQFHEQKTDLLLDEHFQRDFKELHKYYKHTVFAKFAVIGPHLFMVFQIGKEPGDIKTFKWLREGDKLTYLDNRSDHEYRYPPQHEFHFKRTHREMHHKGPYPHISIEDRVFVETVGGDLTIKVENNTESGEGIYNESVVNPDQTLDDAETFYSIVGNLILLKIRPYQEERFRYFVFSEKTRTARRIDGMKNACVLLPDDHGIIFSNGYFLQTGECKIFEQDVTNMLFESRLQSPNGEDFLFTFYDPYTGSYLLLPYNLIEQRVEQPIACNGYSFFENGEMIYFKSHEEPQRHHPLQIWQTPFVGMDYQPAAQADSFLFKIGNKDLVRGMAECHETLNLIGKEDTYTGLYLDIQKKVIDVLDSYYWINNPETFELGVELVKIREAAEAAINEFDKVVSVRRNTAAQFKKVSEATRKVITEVYSRRFEVIQDFVKSLAGLRAVRGDIISLRELRYADLGAIEALEREVAENAETCAKRSVEFLLQPQALQPYDIAVREQHAQIAGQQKVSDAKELEKQIADTAGELEMLIEVVSNLKIDDATQRTAIIDNISVLFSRLNQSRAELKNRIQELAKTEGAAEFGSQVKLLNQSVVNYLDVCDTPEKCEEYLTKLMVALEELEGRFAEFDEFVVQLAEKRDEIYNAFESRKLQLVEKRNKRAQALLGAAERILKGIQTRVRSFESVNEINGYFAADLMIEKIRDIVTELTNLGDTVKVDDVQSRLKTVREDAVRQLKDKQELFTAGENAIRFGRHQFLVNIQPLDLTTVLRDGEMHFHLTGTNFFEAVTAAAFLATREVWTQEIISENPQVYRAEFLVWQLLQSFGKPGQAREEELRGYDGARLLEFVQRFMAPRYNEAYIKGVHDRDACAILAAALEIRATAGLLRYHPSARALARVCWELLPQDAHKTLLASKLRGFGAVRETFPQSNSQDKYIAELRGLLAEFLNALPFFPAELLPQSATYLFEELATGGSFVVSGRARDLRRAFEQYLDEKLVKGKYSASLEQLKDNPASVFLLQRDWVHAFVNQRNDPLELEYADETAALLFASKLDPRQVIESAVERTLDGMTGSHPLLVDKKYELHYSEFMLKLGRYETETVPRFQTYLDLKKELVERKRRELKLDEFRPRVLTSFVRNKLIDQVYLPLIGDNLAKQIGVAGEAKRTDRMGMLLLISPPGYGKTTLMEYIANRLGIIFMKINGPALGHAVTSLDPAEAPNAASREEIEKLNLALEMGDNVMLYVDDIQHCNPEFLQKFISLCDAQRKIEGVYKGHTRTYDLRGKKVCVVMAGNPYTESGEQFKIPDMLANRADTYNLGEIIGGSADVFKLSYLENCLTSNPVLNNLASRSQQDIHAIVKIAETGSQEGVEFKGNYALDEINEMVAVVKKLLRVRDVVLKVNEQYIRSAAQADAYRTEPSFKLQGSYRNMNRIAEKIVAIMNDAELEELILSNYENDAQTLTTGAEANLLKFKELTGGMNEAERERWESIKKIFRRNVELQGVGDDQKFGQLILKLSQFGEGLEQIRATLQSGIGQLAAAEGAGAPETQQALVASLDEATLKTLRELLQNLKTLATTGEAKPRPQPPQSLTASFDTATLAAMQNLIGELKTLSQAIPAAAPAGAAEAARATAAAAPGAMPPIQVVTKVPRAILAVLREQFRLMETWIEPIYRDTQLQNREIDKIVKMIEDSRASYQALIEKLEKSATRKAEPK